MANKRWLAAPLIASACLPAFSDSSCRAASASFVDAISHYKKDGRQAFMDRFLRGGPLGEKMATEGSEHLLNIERVLGPFEDGAVLSAKALGGRACYVIAALEYESGPAFIASTYYTARNGTFPMSLRVEAEPEKMFSTPALISD